MDVEHPLLQKGTEVPLSTLESLNNKEYRPLVRRKKTKIQTGAGLGSRSEPGVFGSLEPEPLEKKSQEPEPVKISRLLSPARR